MKAVVNIVSEELSKTLLEEGNKKDIPEKPVEQKEEDPEKLVYLLQRGVEEVKTSISDLNYEVGDIISEGAKKIKGISLTENGEGVVYLSQSLKLSDVTKASQVIENSKDFPVPPRFASFVSYSLIPPGALSNEVQLLCKVRIPKELMISRVGSDPTENYKKAISVVESFGKELLKIL